MEETFDEIMDKIRLRDIDVFVPGNTTPEQLKEKEEQAIFVSSNNKIKISPEHRTIIIRVNHGNISPYLGENVWPKEGSVQSTGPRGLFGILLSQDLGYLESFSFSCAFPDYLILEVDDRIIQRVNSRTKIYINNSEVEFRECNVLFNGSLCDFLRHLKQYATSEQHKKISDTLEWKRIEILESLQSVIQTAGYFLKTQHRREMMISVKQPALLIKIATNRN